MKINANIRAVFIDIDNTLLDFDAYVQTTMQTGFHEFGIGEYEEWMYLRFREINDALWRRIEDGTLTLPELQKNRWNMVFEAIGLKGDGEEFEKYFRSRLYNCAIPVPGAKELLETLHGNYIVCTASNGPYNQQLHRMEISGMDRYIDFNFISENLGAQKPQKEFFEAAFERLNEGREEKILPSQCLMLGDSMTSDMAGGIAAGMITCYYDPKHKGNGDGVDLVINSLSELIG